jgi:hypothetical protein
MKLSPLVLVIFGFSIALKENRAIGQTWIEVGSSDKAAYFVDTTSIRNPQRGLKNNVRFNTVIELTTPTDKGIKSVGLLIDYDCGVNLSYVVSTSVYRGSMGTNKVDSSTGGGLNFSINQRTRELICRN